MMISSGLSNLFLIPIQPLEFFLNQLKVIYILISYQQEQFLGDNDFPEPDYN